MSHAAPPEGTPTLSRFVIVMLLLSEPKRIWAPIEIEEATTLSRSTVQRAIEALHDSQRVVKLHGGRIRLTTNGRDLCSQWLAQYATPELFAGAKGIGLADDVIEHGIQTQAAALVHRVEHGR